MPPSKPQSKGKDTGQDKRTAAMAAVAAVTTVVAVAVAVEIGTAGAEATVLTAVWAMLLLLRHLLLHRHLDHNHQQYRCQYPPLKCTTEARWSRLARGTFRRCVSEIERGYWQGSWYVCVSSCFYSYFVLFLSRFRFYEFTLFFKI